MTKVQRMLVIGATSAIAHETLKLFADAGIRLVLVGRNTDRLQRVGDDLRTRGATIERTILLDVTDLTRHREVVDQAVSILGGIDVVLIAHGSLGDHGLSSRDPDASSRELMINAVSTLSLLTLIADRMEQQRSGCIAVITSVAGDRGRQSNYVYGAAKAAVDVFLEGLRNRLHKSGVAVVTIKPGLVDTPMTRHLRHNVLFASAAVAGRGVHRAILRRRNVVYVPSYWRWIMLAIRLLPEPLFKRMNL
ncbi:MAG: SDR family oxidoreductase [Thermoanaerobaculia bacterium]